MFGDSLHPKAEGWLLEQLGIYFIISFVVTGCSVGLDHCFFPESQLDVATIIFLLFLFCLKKKKKKQQFILQCFVAEAAQQSFGVKVMTQRQKDKEASRGLFRTLSGLWSLPASWVAA